MCSEYVCVKTAAGNVLFHNKKETFDSIFRIPTRLEDNRSSFEHLRKFALTTSL